MSQLVNQDYQEFLQKIPNNEYDLETIKKIFRENVPKLAKKCKLCFLRVELLSPNNQHEDGSTSEDVVLLDSGNIEEENMKEIVFDLGNGGTARFTAKLEDGTEWTEQIEDDFYVIARTIYIIYGRARAMQFLHNLTFHDSMTGVANEAALYQFMKNAMEKGIFDSYCVNFVNIKNMKLFNERYGHPFGDQMIIQYARKIEHFLGEKGCIARLGGDNFLVIIDREQEDAFLDYMLDIHVDLKLPNSMSISVKMESRVGYYYVRNGNDISIAMANSSIALSQARRDSASDVIRFEDNMKLEMLQTKQLTENVPNALQNEEFVVYYQPKALMEGKSEYTLHGAEALVRWRKNGVMIPPMDFIPLLEENGMITEVDFYVFEHVCLDIKTWEAVGIQPVRISSNFSRRHLRDEHFADKIETIIRKYDINPAYLEIEITESYNIEDMEALNRFESRMFELGIKLSVDDFGSGYSSIKMLKNISAGIIKIDKSIIDGIGSGNQDDETIVAHMIHMIRALGKEVIAEGVEYPSQAEFLQKNDCNMIQGYLFGKPMPKDEFEKELMNQSKKCMS